MAANSETPVQQQAVSENPPHACRFHGSIQTLLRRSISGVLDGIVLPSDEDSADYPSEQTMIRWHHWLMKNRLNIDGQLKSIAYRELDFSQELLKSTDSLLSYIRSFIPDGWLRTIIRFLYNSGNSLLFFY